MKSGDENYLKLLLGEEDVATLILQDDQLIWQYCDSWQKKGFPISPHLPLHNQFPSRNTLNFLKNALPEGHFLEALTQYFQLSKNNTFGLIRQLGLDLPGALIVTAKNSPYSEEATFRKLTDSEVTKRLDERDHYSLLIWDKKPRLSVAGVQDKINIVVNNNHEFGFGEGSLCSTHILKFEKQKFSHLALNEYYSMQLAHFCGINTAKVELKYFGKHAALVVERFDRQWHSLTEVKRRHVIDGCQALNLSPEYKYERNFGSSRDVAHIREGASYPKLFKFTEYCQNPALTKQKLIDWALFNLIIFNFDAHGKNISFFVDSRGISLAPIYDLVNINMYPEFEAQMAMAFGDCFNAEEIESYHLADFSESCSLPRKLVSTRLAALCKSVQEGLNSINVAIKSDEEDHYLKKYIQMIKSRSDNLLIESQKITSITL